MLTRPRPRLGVSVVSFHSEPAALRVTLEAVAGLDPPAERVVLVVNEARDDELAALSGLPAEVWAEQGNTGFSGGHNKVAAACFADGLDGVLVLNPDVRLAPDALARLWEVAEAHGGHCLVGPLLEAGDADLRGTGLIDSAGIRWTAQARHLDDLQGRPLAAAPDAPTAVAGLTGACLLVPRPAYERLLAGSGELFDEDFLAYREDAELALRCAALGIASWLAPAARGVHRRGLKGTARGGSALVDQLGVQNRFLIRFKHGPRRPGNPLLAGARDLLVLAAAATVERSSWPGVRRAWQLRDRMHEKRRRLEAAR